MPTDLMLDENMDLLIENGDFVIGESTLQHQMTLLLADKNDFKQHPDVGVGIESYLDDESPADMHREVRLQFSRDGMKVKSIITLEGKLNIDAEYE